MHAEILSPELRRAFASVAPVDAALEAEARVRLDSLAKPRGSLGRLEDLAARLHAIQGTGALAADPARLYTVAADHGVVAEGVASHPQAITALMLGNFLSGGAAINALCAAAGVDLRVVDAGVAGPPFQAHPLLVNARIAPGSANMAQGPAMQPDVCRQALELGLSLAEESCRQGIRVLGTGEMGIGNTTASSALFCAYLGLSPEEMTGIGAGLSESRLAHKSAVIRKALAVNAGAVESGDAAAILAAVGGIEIAVLAGLVVGGAARRMAVVIDGFIATAAFAAAEAMVPAVRDYCFFSHGSAEAGHARALKRLGVAPLLDLGMRLGEGTGAALGIFLLRAAVRAYNDMVTLEDLGKR
jgi:nicotinate-nucleotide--dimethylbenzimidazole phosphoribosyltransferase